jgi:hypothetical protein
MTDPTHAPPPRPWKKGDQGHYSALVVELRICRDAGGRVFSEHILQDDADREVAMSWEGGGQEEVAFALLVEAVRREALLEAMMAATKDPHLLSGFAQFSIEEREGVVRDLTQRLRVQVEGVVSRLASGAVEEALHSLSGG